MIAETGPNAEDERVLQNTLRQITGPRLLFALGLVVILSPLDLAPAPQKSSRAGDAALLAEAQEAMVVADYDRAIELYQKLARTHTDSAPLFLQVGIAQYQKGDVDSAASSFGRALELQPKFPVAEAFLGLSEAALGHSDRALPLLDESFRSGDPDIGPEMKRLIGLRLGKIYTRAGSLNDAEAIYLALLKMEPENPEVLYQKFWLHMARAREMMRKLLQKHGDSYLTHEMIGHLLAENQNYAAAAEQFRLALKDNPTAVGLHYQLGNMLLAQADRKSAHREYEEELRLHSSHAESYYQLAEVALSDQQLDQAWKLYTTVLQFDPNHANALVGLAKIQMRKNQPLEALTYCEKAVKLEPANPSAHYMLARAYTALGRASEAGAHLQLFQRLKSEEGKEKEYFSSMRAGRLDDR